MPFCAALAPQEWEECGRRMGCRAAMPSSPAQGFCRMAWMRGRRCWRPYSSTAPAIIPTGWRWTRPATAASLAGPESVAVDRWGNLYIADTGNGRVRRVDAVSGIITTVAGGGSGGPGGPAVGANIGSPTAVAVDSSGSLYILGATSQ